jgi:hypothetical protein
MRKQRGMGFLGVLVLIIGIVLAAILGMKLVPAYIEYFTIKKAVTSIVQSGELRNATVADVRKAFDRRATIDDITAITPGDLEVSKDGNEVVIAFAYQKKIPLFHNVSVLIDFAGTSKPGSNKAAD